MKELVEAWREGHCPEVGKVLVGPGAELCTPVPMPRSPCSPKGWIQLATPALPMCLFPLELGVLSIDAQVPQSARAAIAQVAWHLPPLLRTRGPAPLLSQPRR